MKENANLTETQAENTNPTEKKKDVYLTDDLFIVKKGYLMEYYGDDVKEETLILPDDADVITNNATHRFHDYAVMVVVPEGVKELDRSCFMHFEKMVDLTLPQSLEAICDSAFYYCKSLTQLYLPDSIGEIGGKFIEGTSIEEIALPKALPCPSHWMFDMASNLKVVRMSDEQFELMLYSAFRKSKNDPHAKELRNSDYVPFGNSGLKTLVVDGVEYDGPSLRSYIMQDFSFSDSIKNPSVNTTLLRENFKIVEDMFIGTPFFKNSP